MSITSESIRNGVDTEKLFATLDAVKAQPELGTFQFRVHNRWLGGAHNRSTIKSFYAAFLNSAIVAVSVTALTLLFGSLSAYTIARLRFRWTLFLLQANIVARFVPVMGLGLFGGVIADNLPKRQTLIGTQLVQMVLAFLLTALAVTGVAQVWHVLILAFFLGCANAIDMPRCAPAHWSTTAATPSISLARPR